MAVTTVLTGTSQNISATNGSANITFTSGVATNWVVGATIQGTGIPSGTKIASITGTPSTATAATLSANFTGTTGTVSVIVSSNTGTLTVTLSASGDTASPQTLITNGFGLLRGNKSIEIFGATKIILQIATGAIWNDTEWVYELGNGSSLRLNESYGCGTWLSGYILNGSVYVKAKGHTVNYNNFDNSSGAGGRGICFQSGMPPGFVAGTTQPTLKWNDVGWYEAGGSNGAAILGTAYSKFDAGRIVFDYSGDSAGANAGFTGSYGTIESLLLYRCIGGVSAGSIDTTKVTTIGKLEYFSLPTNGGGSNPDIRMAFPNNIPFSGFAPLFWLSPASNEFIACNTTANEILLDYILPTGYNVLTNSRNYSAGTRTYQRTVTFNINDSTATPLTNTTLYITSGSNVLINAVQSGNFSQGVNAAYCSWIGRVGNAYIAPLTTIDTRSQTAQLRKYGYIQQSVSYSLQDNAYSQPIYLLTDTRLSAISESTASAITTAGINWSTKTITPTANLTYDQINARIAWELAQTANSDKADPRTISGTKLSLATGWTLVVNSGITINPGTYITSWFTPTITNNGTIVGTYSDSTGTFAKLLVDGLSTGMVAKLVTGSTVLSSVVAGSSSEYLGYFIPSGGTNISATLYVEKATGQANGYNLYKNVLTLGDSGASTTAIMLVDGFYGRSSGRTDRANVSVAWNATTGVPTITLSGNTDVRSVYDVVCESHATIANITYQRPTTSDGITYQFGAANFTGTGRLTGSNQFFTTGSVSIVYDLILNQLNTINFLPNTWVKIIKSSDNSVITPYALNTQGKVEINVGTGVNYKVFLKKDGYKPLVQEINSGTGQVITLTQTAQAFYNATTDITALIPLLDVTNTSGVLSIVSVGAMSISSAQVCAVIDYLQKDEDYADVALVAGTGDIWVINSQYQSTPNPTYVKITRKSTLTVSDYTIWDTYLTSSSTSYPDTAITPIQSSTGLWVITNRSAVGEVTIKNEQAQAIATNASEYVWSKVLENGKTANKNIAQSNSFDSIISTEVQKTN